MPSSRRRTLYLFQVSLNDTFPPLPFEEDVVSSEWGPHWLNEWISKQKVFGEVKVAMSCIGKYLTCFPTPSSSQSSRRWGVLWHMDRRDPMTTTSLSTVFTTIPEQSSATWWTWTFIPSLRCCVASVVENLLRSLRLNRPRMIPPWQVIHVYCRCYLQISFTMIDNNFFSPLYLRNVEQLFAYSCCPSRASSHHFRGVIVFKTSNYLSRIKSSCASGRRWCSMYIHLGPTTCIAGEWFAIFRP